MTGKLTFTVAVLLCVSLLVMTSVHAEDEYQFDLSEIEKEIEKKPYSFGGFLEFNPKFFKLDDDAAFKKLRLYDQDEGKTLEQYDFGLRLEGSYEKGIANIYARTDSLLRYDYDGWDSDTILQEGYLSLAPGPSFNVDAGKKVMQWGKGYAFNPVAFVSRPKNPDDPVESLEGFYMLSADIIRSFQGPLKTMAFTPVLIPVSESLNDDFGKADHINVAAKLYFLFMDTDLDLLFFTGDSRSTRYGVDFSRNIRTNFEVHGELAWITDFNEKSIDSQGTVSTEESDIFRGLAGIRYLTTNDITFFVEYYYNGGGIDDESAENFYGFVDRAYDTFLSTGDSSQLEKAARLSKGTLSTAKPMRDYLYFRASWKEPFNILYFTPALTSLLNLNDMSYSITPELSYAPKTNLDLRLRTAFLVGADDTEYGEKLSDCKVELRIRYYY